MYNGENRYPVGDSTLLTPVYLAISHMQAMLPVDFYFFLD